MDRFRQQRPLGPQIHAVPENEKAYDASGKKLPWAYDTTPSFTIDGDREQRPREAAEKGAFGKSRGSRRNTSRSRSKTAEPQRAEDAARKEQVAAEEKVFGSLRRVVRDEGRREVLGEVDGNTVAQPSAAAVGKLVEEQEATEVLLYGFGEDLQWSAIDFYERVSGGVVLEDYERTPHSQLRSYDPAQSYARATMQKSLSKAALRKKNRYAGGEHWIKVTFASREAAELACARSPHIVKGHLVYAEPWQGRGPARDEGIVATQAGVQVVGDVLPPSFATSNVGGVEASPNGSQTVSSKTVAEEDREERGGVQGFGQYGNGLERRSTGADVASVDQQLQRRQMGTVSRIRGAQLATLLPAEQALMPKQPKQSWTAWLGASELIGTTVPRKEDGAFDYEKASLYWRLWNWVDGWFGTDFCGLRGDE